MNDQVIISPSILSCDFLNIEKEVSHFNKIPNLWIHLDVMDGHFVPNLTFGAPIIKNLHQVTSHPLDAHLMVSNPKDHLEWFKDCHLHNITIHHEASVNAMDVLEPYRDKYPSLGISIKPKTPVESLSQEVLEFVDLILIMSVEPGFGGQKFMPHSLEKTKILSQLKFEHGYKYQIQIDGGINQETAALAVQSGCQNLVAGSHIFKNNPQDYPKVINKLREG